ncbi:endonuclease/exonuclease/phosphatase family protein [Oceanobacillus caeni]|uniref:endonuclease/exonuclease/phosphatase family protein n=1 Tax=Oceanobacillus caeni TaxID=405946 RepID=UPI00195CA043
MTNMNRKKILIPALFFTVIIIITGILFVNKLEQLTETEVKVMTYNIRFLNDRDASPHTWEERLPTITQLIEDYKPDVFGTQEAVYQQLNDLKAHLPNYKWVGVGREGGINGEHTAIFYNKIRFSLIEHGNFWLSDTPNEPGSKNWENKIPRIATWVKLFDKESEQQFYVFNTHFDHHSVESRIKSAKLIIEQINELNTTLPILLTGDFNSYKNSLPFKIFINKGDFVDTWSESDNKINGDFGTVNHFYDPTGGGPNQRFDWILAKGNVSTKSIEIIVDRNNYQFPSDHYPVLANLTINFN